jgi:hypothetical protein
LVLFGTAHTAKSANLPDPILRAAARVNHERTPSQAQNHIHQFSTLELIATAIESLALEEPFQSLKLWMIHLE